MTTKTNKPATSRNTKTNSAPRARSRAAARRAAWRNAMKAVGTFLTSRSRDLALMAIVGGAFVAVFDGSRYSAVTFSFIGFSAIAFAIMPDALMVLAAAKMRQVGITAAQWRTARTWMRASLAFSLFTNMIAAFLRNAPEAWITRELLLVGAIIYHGMVVVFLWGATEVLTKTRTDRKDAKAPKASEAPATPAAQAPPMWTKPVSWADTALAALMGSRKA